MSADTSKPRAPLNPTIEFDGRRLVATTSPLVRLLTFGGYFRRTVVDRGRGAVWLERKVLWVFSRIREIALDRVRRLEVDSEEVGAGIGQQPADGPPATATTLWLVLDGVHEERVRLLDLVGTGPVALDVGLARSREVSPGELATLLADLIGVPVGGSLRSERDAVDERGRRWRCSVCDRSTPPRRASCERCGGETAPAATLDGGGA